MKTDTLVQIADGYKKKESLIKKRIIICAGTACVANGSLKIRDMFVSRFAEQNIPAVVELNEHSDNAVHVSKSGCQGFCQMGPLVTILPDNILYTKVKITDVDEIIQSSVLNDSVVERLLYREPNSKKQCRDTSEIPFYKKQHRFVIKKCGVVDPECIAEYISLGGYEAAAKACIKMTRESVCEEIKRSGLRGRGGGGFSTGLKWELTAREPSSKKYVICNGDEGDPGAFMDRSIMEGNPHSVIEGMIIAARGIGADEGYVYVRTEYQLAVQRMRKAVEDAEKSGVLGKNIFGTNLNFTLHVMEGAGAFVCGEETALIESIEGKRGMPRPKPPYPAKSGLKGKPTVINNVETLATVPLIIASGADAFKKTGTEKSPGTKTFAITGHVANTGLIEVPFGTTLREIIFEIAGGVTASDGTIDEKNFKAVQIGGPSGGCLTREHLDLPLDFDSLKTVGAMVGSGGLVVMNTDTCMVSVARFFMDFTRNESCGKCVLCREGTKQMLAMLDEITMGRADERLIENLQAVAHAVRKGSLCGLGKTAPNPVLSTLHYFKNEYDAHVADKRCPSGSCKDLVKITIVPEKCKGCTVCARKCPVGAITGERGQPHAINDACIKCGVCIESCKFGAIVRGGAQ